MKKRITWIDIVKAISTLMVIDVHMVSGVMFPTGDMYHLMPFFFLPGVLKGIVEKPRKVNLIENIKRKARQILIPYAALSVANIAIVFCIELVKKKPLYSGKLLESLVKTITFQGIGTLWFLPVMFIASVLFEALVSRLNEKKKNLFWGLLIFSGTIIMGKWLEYLGYTGNTNVGVSSSHGIMAGLSVMAVLSCMAVGVMLMGYGVSVKLSHLFRPEKWNLCVVIMMMALSLVACQSMKCFFYANLRFLTIGNPVVFWASSLCGICFVCTLAYLISLIPKINGVLAYVGSNSLIIMTTHKEFFICYIIPLLFSKAMHLELPTESLFWKMIMLVIVLTVELIIIIVVNRTPLKRIYGK